MRDRITDREFEMLVYLAHGWTIVEVARYAGIKPQTVKNLVGSAYRKLGVKNRCQAFMELRWLDPPQIPWS